MKKQLRPQPSNRSNYLIRIVPVSVTEFSSLHKSFQLLNKGIVSRPHLNQDNCLISIERENMLLSVVG